MEKETVATSTMYSADQEYIANKYVMTINANGGWEDLGKLTAKLDSKKGYVNNTIDNAVFKITLTGGNNVIDAQNNTQSQNK